jgi:heptosyltransferase-2
MKAPEKILVIRFSSIGDIVLASPLIRVLRKRFPSMQIDFVVRKEYSDLVRYNPHLNNVYEFDAAGGLKELQRLKAMVLSERYDLVVDIHNSLRSRYLRSFIGTKNIVSINKRIFARTMLVRFKMNCYRDMVSVADRYIEPVRQYGIENDNGDLELFLPENVQSHITDTIVIAKHRQSTVVIGFCPSAKHNTKRWPQERFVELGTQLVKNNDVRIYIFGSTSDSATCGFIANAINVSTGEGSAIDFSGQFSLLETAAAMQSANVIVTNDTGLMHIATAMKKRVVAIFGSTVREFGFFPVGQKNIVVERKGLSCRPCSHIGRKNCPKGHFRCMLEIQVDEVVEAVRRLITTT